MTEETRINEGQSFWGLPAFKNFYFTRRLWRRHHAVIGFGIGLESIFDINATHILRTTDW